MTDQHRPDPPGELTEDQLRDLLRHAVATVQPEPGALPRLRAAVPRRRAARRRALGGAVVLAGAVAVLPVVHAAQPFNLSGDPTGGQAAPGDTSGPGNSAAAPGLPHSAATATVSGRDGVDPEASPDPSADGSSGASPADVPSCTRADLGRAGAQQADAAQADGRIYGWFRLTNTAGRPCRVTDPGALDLGAGTTGVRLVAHTVGDPASALPDPAGLPHELLLGPGASFLVRFAWVPTLCATASPSPTGPQPGPAASAGALPGIDAQTDSAPAIAAADPSPTAEPTPAGPPAAATFALGYTPDPATGPAATIALPAGCGGTVYHSAPEPVPAAGPAPSPSATT
ncbi:hypothetical protein ACIQF6_07665 [Kitasatospora sp. NPDC092948]|uniref:hypothetical protein n=1 Tax=Kitasatospora sp. NPDC092948 TaxID=3364088 RepID=UPI0038187ACD